MSQYERAAAELLKSARALIADERHWVKGTYSQYLDWENLDERAYCMLGALAFADIGSQAYPDARAALVDALPNPDVGIPNFNDAPGTTHADVLRVYDLAIATLEADNA